MNEIVTGQNGPDTNGDCDQTGFIGVVELDDYADVLRNAESDLLMVFLRRDETFPDYFEKLAILENNSVNGLRIRIVAAGSEDELMRIFGVGGTPAFLLFRKGVEVGRVLGDSDPGRIVHNM